MAEEVRYQLILDGIDSLNAKLDKGKSGIDGMENSIGKLKNSIMGLAAAYVSIDFAKSVVETTSKFETLNNVINFTSKDAADASKNHAFLSEIISKYKLPIQETTEGFSQLNAAMLGSNLQGEGTRKIFEGVSVATTAMHLSAQQSESVFLALNQMMSKGKVQAQEMTLQLGQSLPGALRLASKSMNMTTAEFSKAMENGLIKSEEFLPKFADTLKKTFSGAIPTAVESLQARMTEMSNKFIEFKLVLGEALMPVINMFISTMTTVGNVLISTIKWMKENSDMVKSFAQGLAFAGTVYLTFITYQKLSLWYTGLSTAAIVANTLVTEGWRAAVLALNIAMEANPIGLVIVALGALAIAIMVVYNWNEKLKGQYSGSMKESINQGLEDEKKRINELVGSYEKLGNSKKEAQKIVVALEKSGLEATIKTLEQNVGKGNEFENFENQKRLSTAKAQLGLITNKETLAGVLSGGNKGAASIAVDQSSKVTGTKQVTINVSINKLVELIKIEAKNIKEGANTASSDVAKALLGAVNQFSASADI